MSCTSMPKCSRSELSVGEADQRGNTEGGEGTLREGSRVEEADQRDNVGREEIALEKGSPSLLSEEEADQSDTAGGGEVALKKGPWTKEEDEILLDHIKKHGKGNWNAVQKNSGLARCGKSCRLRWFNHLRPGRKTGRFTAEEEQKIIELHFLKGSKWAQMAALLPGRTDNEIKNFWNSRSKKRKRAGLPIYPSEISSKYSYSGSQESADITAIESRQHDETENFNLDITDLDLKDFKFSADMLPTFFDSQYSKPISDLVGRCSDSFHKTLTMRRAVVQPRYLFSSSSTAVPEVFDQYVKYPMLSTPSDLILNTNLLPGYDNPIAGFHTASTISSSEPVYGSMRVELPSFQNSYTQQRSWDGKYVSQLPSFESVDTPVQAPPVEPCPFVPASPDCSHLIDPIVYYNSDQNLKGSNIDSLLQANTDNTAPNEADISTQWNGLDDDQRAAVVTCQLDFLRSVRQRRNFLRWVRSEIETPLDYDINHGAFNDQLPAYDTSNKEDNLNQKDLVLPNAVIDSGWH